MGFTVMVNEVGVPLQVTAPLVNCGVTVMVAVMGALVVLVVTKEAILPIPLAPSPMAGLSFTQLKTVPGTNPEKVTSEVEEPTQITCPITLSTVGMGLTVMVNKVGVPVQVTPELVKEGVTVMVAVTGALVVLLAVKAAMSPEPVAASPMEISELIQLYTVPVTFPENETTDVEVL